MMWAFSTSASLQTAPFDERQVDVLAGSPWDPRPASTRRPPARPGRAGARRGPGTTCGSRSSRRARRSPLWVLSSRAWCSWVALPHQGQVGKELPPLGHLGHGGALVGQAPRSGRRARTCRRRCRTRTRPTDCSRSLMMNDLMPRPLTSLVWAPSISSQTRTQRVQRMQRLWSRRKRSCELSTLQVGIAVRQVDVVDAELLGHGLQFAVAVGDADRADVVALGEAASR